MTDYERGFLTKCAEAGLSTGDAIGLMQKQALKIPKLNPIEAVKALVGKHQANRLANRASRALDGSKDNLFFRYLKNLSGSYITDAQAAKQVTGDALSKVRGEMNRLLERGSEVRHALTDSNARVREARKAVRDADNVKWWHKRVMARMKAKNEARKAIRENVKLRNNGIRSDIDAMKVKEKGLEEQMDKAEKALRKAHRGAVLARGGTIAAIAGPGAYNRTADLVSNVGSHRSRKLKNENDVLEQKLRREKLLKDYGKQP